MYSAIYYLSCLVIIGNLILASIVFLSNRKKASNQIYSFLAVVFSSWVLAMYYSVNSATLQDGLFWTRTTTFLAVYQSIGFFLLAKSLPQDKLQLRKAELTFIVVGGILVSLLTYSPYMFTSIREIDGMPLLPIASPLAALFGAYTISLSLRAVFLLHKQYLHAPNNLKQKYFLPMLGIIFFVGSAIFIIFLPVTLFRYTTLIPLFPIPTLFFTVLTAYAILKHRLFGLLTVLGRVIFWLFIAGGLLFSFYIIALLELRMGNSLSDPNVILLNLVVCILIIFLLSLFESKIKSSIRTLLLQFSFDPKKETEQFIIDASDKRSTEEIVQTLFAIVEKTLSPKKLGIVILSTENTYEGLFTEFVNFSDNEIKKLEDEQNINLLLNNGPVLELNQQLNVDMALPLRHGHLTGALLLGKRDGDQAYSEDELEFLERRNVQLEIRQSVLQYGHEKHITHHFSLGTF